MLASPLVPEIGRSIADRRQGPHCAIPARNTRMVGERPSLECLSGIVILSPRRHDVVSWGHGAPQRDVLSRLLRFSWSAYPPKYVEPDSAPAPDGPQPWGRARRCAGADLHASRGHPTPRLIGAPGRETRLSDQRAQLEKPVAKPHAAPTHGRDATPSLRGRVDATAV